MKTRAQLFTAAIAVAVFPSGAGLAVAASANSTTYHQLDLVADKPGGAQFTDPNLVNAWGVIPGPGGRSVVAANHSGMLTMYGRDGRPSPLTIAVPAPGGGTGAPTDLAMNPSGRSFIITKGSHHGASVLLTVTEDGTILGWNPRVDQSNAVIAVDNSAAGAIYKGVALVRARRALELAAANFGQGRVEFYDGNWHLIKTYTDTELFNAGYVPFGIREIGTRLFVAYAFKANPADGDETAGPGLGYVDELDTAGNLVRRFASQGTLNAPWGLTQAPNSFGKFGGALLVGNFGDGAINAYNLRSGAFLGQLTKADGSVLAIGGLWGLSATRNGAVYFAAGPDDEQHGLYGAILRDNHK